ncbi:MAG: NADH-quinone oxidoreductase subunit E [Actinobacteria bacterium]|nr:NADH-quinone oxidoreductase subunit E [Actinomycetota bacterium]
MTDPRPVPVALPVGPPVTRPRRDALLPALHEAHDAAGWLAPEALDAIADRLRLGRAEVFGVASSYASFAFTPRPRRLRRVCTGVMCVVAGAEAPGADAPGVVASPCLGRCEQAPAVLDTDGGRAVAPVAPAPVPQPPTERSLLRRVGVVDPSSLDDYRAHGGTAALGHARTLGPAAVRAAVTASGLTGRGGAAFPAGRKWEAVAAAAGGPKYVVANADESEPGTFKDRVVLEHDPFAVVEAMVIAGFAVGATTGYVYVRDEYPEAIARLEHAIDAAGAAGLLGDDAGGLGVPFRIEVRRGAGAYVCGEETALFASIEGYRGEPRTKPPFPVDAGLFGRPTLVHNVETLANVLTILDPSGPRPETKLFSVSGAVTRPGLYEVPMGTTLAEVLDLAGGVPAGRTLQAVLLGGAAGTFLHPEEIGVPLTVEATRAIGATVGSGAVFVIDDTTDLATVVLGIATFFREESCGQCVPCRVGTVRQEEVLHRLVHGRPLGSVAEEVQRLRDVGAAMRDASICGLGQFAWNAIEGAVDRFGVFGAST